MVRLLRSAIALAIALAALLATAPAQASCDTILPAPGDGSGMAQRPVTARDLIELREVGSQDSASFLSPSPFAVSPDGTRVAYVVNRADLATDSYCRALVVSAVAAPGAPTVVNRGGERIEVVDVDHDYYLPTGLTAVVVPVWSPDGRRLAYLRRDSGRNQAWVAEADGSGARQVSQAASDVVAVGWSSDGKRTLFGTAKGAVAAEQAIDREGAHGWLYDARISPEIAVRPRLRATSDLSVFAADLASGTVAAADARDRARLQAAPLPGRPVDLVAVATDGRRASLAPTAPSPMAPATLIVTLPSNEKIRCMASPCTGGILSLWWHAGAVVFLRREGWDKEITALYRWMPGQAAPVALLRTTDVLHGCADARGTLVCTRENSVTPRRIVAIDMATAAERMLFDPNPAFEHIRLGAVRRLRWRNTFGLEAWGDLVLPPDYRPGARLPMVVVQYHSLGFLRGGTGDEYPIFLLAQRGFAVLSTERPPLYGSILPKLTSWDQIIAANEKNWSERRSLLSSVLAGVRLTIDRGYADPARVGITGLSDGSTTVAFALIHSHAFAAAALSTCCIEPNTTMTYGGIAWADWLRSIGYPPATAHDDAFWHDMSIAQNAAAIDTPLLMQLSDKEFRLALEAFSALREQHKPVEMDIFPGESHIKAEPVHREAVYDRSLDWFSFWLQGTEDPTAGKIAQYARWHDMRAELNAQSRESHITAARAARPRRRPTP